MVGTSRQSIRHHDITLLHNSDTADSRLQLALEYRRQIELRSHKAVGRSMGCKSRMSGGAVQRIVYRKRIMHPVVVTQYPPTIGMLSIRPDVQAVGFEEFIILPSQILRPAHTVSLHDERPGIHVRMVARSRTALYAYEQGVRIAP